MIVYVNIIIGVVLTLIGMFTIRQVAIRLGASEAMLADAVLYGRILLLGNAAFMLQNSFQSFFPVAEKPQNGLVVTVGAGVTNMVLDFLFVAVFHWGVAGKAKVLWETAFKELYEWFIGDDDESVVVTCQYAV